MSAYPAIPVLTAAMCRKPPGSPPAVNWADPIARGLVWCVPFYEGFDFGGGGAEPLYRDLTGGPIGHLVRRSSGTLLWVQGIPGRAIEPASNSLQQAELAAIAPNDFLPHTQSDATILVYFRVRDSLALPGPSSSETWFHLSRTGVGAASGIRIHHAPAADDVPTTLNVALVQSSSITLQWTHSNELDLLIIARKRAPSPDEITAGTYVPDFDVSVNGLRRRSAASVSSASVFWRRIMLNGRVTNTGPVDDGNGRHYLAAVWRRYLSDEDLARLTADPFVFLRPSDELPALPYYMPCFDYEGRRIMLKPIEQTAATAGVLLARKANRIDQERVEIRLELLDVEELAALEAAWAGGEGLVVPFWMQLPGEDIWRRFVFADDRLAIEHLSATARRASLALIDVTRQG